jgi:hypothetical protein
LLGVLISACFYARLEKRKMKTEAARKLFASRYDMHGPGFHEAMNEIMIAFPGCQKVIDLIEELFKVVETPKSAHAEKASDEALLKLIKAFVKMLVSFIKPCMTLIIEDRQLAAEKASRKFNLLARDIESFGTVNDVRDDAGNVISIKIELSGHVQGNVTATSILSDAA